MTGLGGRFMNCHRVKPLTCWLTFTAFLAASSNPAGAAFGTLTVAPTVEVKGHAEMELTLKCGDGKNAGVVQYWHTPFGVLHNPGDLSKLDPVYMHHDRSLVLTNLSGYHRGLYHCLLRRPEGSTLFPYEFHVDHDNQQDQADGEQACSRFRREVRSVLEEQEDVSDGQFAGAVAASVLLTFVLGFSAGALSRTHVLRCLGAVTRLKSPQQSDMQDRSSEVSMTTTPPMYHNQAFRMEQDDSMNRTFPPAKPQRSFRDKRQVEEQESTAYMEGCDLLREEEKKVEGLRVEEKTVQGEARIEEEYGSRRPLGESKSKTDEEKCREDEEERDEGSAIVEGEEKEEGAGGQEEMRGDEETRAGEKTEEEEGGTDTSSQQSSTDSEEDGTGEGEPPSSLLCRERPSRVIRLYQYDEDGQRYSHLPRPGPDEPGPAPRLKQRSASLTRLSAIMAAASAGPQGRETESEEMQERPRFHLEI